MSGMTMSNNNKNNTNLGIHKNIPTKINPLSEQEGTPIIDVNEGVTPKEIRKARKRKKEFELKSMAGNEMSIKTKNLETVRDNNIIGQSGLVFICLFVSVCICLYLSFLFVFFGCYCPSKRGHKK